MTNLPDFKPLPDGYEPKADDEVLVHGTLSIKPCGEVHIKFAHAGVTLFAPLLDLVAIKDRPIGAGVRVRYNHHTMSGHKGTAIVVSVSKHRAWLEWNDGEETIENLTNLERAQ